MHVRKADIHDLETITAFILEEAREAEGRTQDARILRRGIGAALEDNSIAEYWLLVDDGGNACGCTSVVKEWSDWNAGYYWWIQSMYIAPTFRGMGYINVLLESVAESARATNCLEIRLYVHEDNTVALRAYQKAGFGHSHYLIMSKPV